MQGPISLKRDDDDDNGMQGPISLKRDAASFSASVQHCTLRPLAGCTDLTGHRSFAIIIFQRQGKLPTADAFLILTSPSSSSQCERWYCPINDLGKVVHFGPDEDLILGSLMSHPHCTRLLDDAGMRRMTSK